MTSGKWWIAAGCVGATAVLAYLAARHPMDFRVYYYGARGVFDGTKPVYGVDSGLGWPMHYRYPPLFLLLFAPFAALPLGTSAALWTIFKAIALAGLVMAIVRRFPMPVDRSWWIAILLAAPYVIQEFHYGNAQLFVFALTAASLLITRTHPLKSAASLALAISLKVWPLFFVPYLAVRGDRKTVAWTLILTLGMTLLPSVYFGVGGNFRLLEQWFHQEYLTQTGAQEIWFPSQSLRGVLMRYLTVIDYSQVPDSNYKQIQIAELNAGRVRSIWLAAAAIIYGLFLAQIYRRRRSDGWIESGLAFCLLALLQPFTQKYALVVLVWPAIVAVRLMHERTARILIYAALALALIQPLIAGAMAQRFMQVMGFDFAVTALLAAALATGLTSKEHPQNTTMGFA